MSMTDGKLWDYRTKPQQDELFLSWLVRLAWGSAVKLQTLTTVILGMPPRFLTGDIDRMPDSRALDILCARTATPLHQGVQTGLNAYEGFLWQQYVLKGPLIWVLPIGRDPHNGRHRSHFGLQYCRQCLEQDEKPYFRRDWRLGFHVCCVEHGIYLNDSCPWCHRPVEFHTGDLGQRLLSLDCPITLCGHCHRDLRSQIHEDIAAPKSLLSFQQKLNDALINGWHLELPGAQNYSHLFFEGLRQILSLLVHQGRFSRARDYLLSASGSLDVVALATQGKPTFEMLRLCDRAFALEMANELLQNWPDAFVWICKRSRVSSSYVVGSMKSLPYWLHKPVYGDLFDLDYAPCAEERKAVIAYLHSHELEVNNNRVRQLLGLSAGFSDQVPAPKLLCRWNPRTYHYK